MPLHLNYECLTNITLTLALSVPLGLAVVTAKKLLALAQVPRNRVPGESESPSAVVQSAELEEASQLNQQVVQLQKQGQYGAAVPLAKRALGIRERVLEPDHPAVATSLSNLAVLFQDQGDYPAARPLYERALRIYEKALGPDHPAVATSLNNLAVLFQGQGDYAAARPLVERVLRIEEKALGPDHPTVATSLNNLAELLKDQGDYVAARPLVERALRIHEKALGPNHPDVAISLNNLAGLLQNQGDYAAARPLFEWALRVREKALGPEHFNVGSSLNNLALLLKDQGDYTAARPLYERALRIHEKALGPEHPAVGSSLNNLATLLKDQGDYTAARPLYERALIIHEKALGPDHPYVATSLSNLAVLIWQEDTTRAIELETRRADIQEHNLDLILALGSEREKQAYTATLVGSTQATVSLHLQHAPTHPQMARLALTTLLRCKGRVLDVLANTLQLLRQHLPEQDRPLLDRLASVRSQQASLVFNKTDNLTQDQIRKRLTDLQEQDQQLEADLARRSTEFRAQSTPVTLDTVQNLLPADTALVELVCYQPFNIKATKQDQKWVTPRYAAYVLSSQGEPQSIDLGDARAIDQGVAELRALLRRPSTDPLHLRRTARRLDTLLMQPVRKLLGTTRKLLLSPDSQLSLLPFAALVDEHDQHLLQTYSITYLTSGRDLLRLQTPSPERQAPVLLADPAYSLPGTPVLLTSAGKTPARRSSELIGGDFEPLPGTAAEAVALKSIVPDMQVLTGTQATENALKQLHGPRLLHIATHGFFLSDQPELDVAALWYKRDLVPMLNPFALDAPTRLSSPLPENPLLRSGLALAGANLRLSSGEDGILSALEAASLDLGGTKLVVLSACETGLGNVANGEGVYGLRRALVMAGAESQLISLWKVDDEGTKDLMVGYYERLMRSEGRGEALRQVQLEMLGSLKYAHPYYWAAFIASGNWKGMAEAVPQAANQSKR